MVKYYPKKKANLITQRLFIYSQIYYYHNKTILLYTYLIYLTGQYNNNINNN